MSSGRYKEYVSDGEFIRGYSSYQSKYADLIRESDRVILDLLARLVPGGAVRLADIGCSTGNLLRHLKARFPELELVGGDLTPDVLEQCRRDPELAGVDFRLLDLLDLPERAFDVVVVNAVLYLLSDEEYAEAAASVARSLRPGGSLISFDFFHSFEQGLEIRETSRTHPRGLMLHFRPIAVAREVFESAGFVDLEFRRFEIPIDLPRPEDDGELISYTLASASDRLLFRGALYQPWGHLIARLPE